MIDLRDSTDPEIAIAATVLATLDAAARTAGVPLVVVGAMARNILSAGCSAGCQRGPRATSTSRSPWPRGRSSAG